MKLKMIAILLAALTLCGCSNSSHEAELQSEIDELKSQVEELNEKNSSGSDDEDPGKPGLPFDDDKPSMGDSVYDGIDWDNIPEAPASDFGYRIYYGDYAEDPDLMAEFTGDSSIFVKSIYIYDYYGHDKFVKIPKEIEGLPVTDMGAAYPGGSYREYPWDHESELIEFQCDYSVFKGSNVENVFIPEHLRRITETAFDDCGTLKSISVDPNNLAFFSENGVLYKDWNVDSSSRTGHKEYVYTKLPKYTYTLSDSGRVESFDIQDEGEWVMKTPDCAFGGCCYIDSGLSEFALSDSYHNVIKFTDGTYGALDEVTNKYIPINASQFKREIHQSLFRYPEGKRDKSYMLKKSTWISFDDKGNEQVNDDSVILYSNRGGGTLAFNNVKYLEKLEFEDGVESIYNAIWQDSKSNIPIGVEKVVIPASLVSLGGEIGAEGYYNAFPGLTELKEYEVNKNNPIFKSVDGALLSKDGKILYSMPCRIGKRYTVPDGVKIIAPYAFANAQDMTITIPASVKYLGINSLEEIPDSSEIRRNATSVFGNSSDITLNVSSKTKIRDIFEELPEWCESWYNCSGITVNFVD